MIAELKNQEIRNILRNIEPKLRRNRVKGNLAFIQAASGAPDEIISEDFIKECRREIAFKENPELKVEEEEAKEIYNFVRRRAGEANATGIKILIQNKLDDPLPAAELYATFPPRTDHEKLYVDKRILEEGRAAEVIARKKRFEQEKEGTNLDVQRRISGRNKASIPHRL